MLHKFRPILFALLLAVSQPLAGDFEDIVYSDDGEMVYSDELISAPVQGVRTSISPLAFFVAVGAVVGVAAIILSCPNASSSHSD